MTVSVVIPAYNEEKYLGKCLESLLHQTVSADEILVVDNNSTDKTAKIAATMGATVIRQPVQGMIPTRNAGFDKAKGEIILRTDADTQVPPYWIERIKQHFADDPELLGVSGPAKFYDAPKFLQNKSWPSRLAIQDALSQFIRHDGMFGPNMALRKKAWHMVKNEVCINDKEVHEDMDLAIHLGQYGKIFFDEALIVASSIRRWKKPEPYFEYTLRYVKTIEKHKRWMKRLKKATSMKTMMKKTKKTLKTISTRTRETLSM